MSPGYRITDEDLEVPQTFSQPEDTRIVQADPAPSARPWAQAACDWLEDVARQFRAIARLPSGWDCDGASPPNPEVLDRGFSLLECLARVSTVPKPHVNPTRNGGIQFEWESTSRYFEIEVVAPGAATYFYQDRTANLEDEGEIFVDESLDVVVRQIWKVAAAS